MTKITVTPQRQSVYRVAVEDDTSRTSHDVTVTEADIARYAPGTTAERLLDASFRFLLEREPKESILTQFALPVIERYFPEYPATIRDRMEG